MWHLYMSRIWDHWIKNYWELEKGNCGDGNQKTRSVIAFHGEIAWLCMAYSPGNHIKASSISPHSPISETLLSFTMYTIFKNPD